MRMALRWVRRALRWGLAAGALPWGQAAGQGRLVGYRSSSLGAVYEYWSFPDGVPQPTPSGRSTVLIGHSSQLSIPVAIRVPLSENWNIDLTSAYSTGKVVLTSPDPELNTSEYSLSGVTDVRLRVTGRVTPNLSLALGLNAPTGKTSLDAEEYSALRVLGAPPLGFQIPRLGNGLSATLGVVASRQLGEGWAGALGVSYEARGKYDPGFLFASLSDPELAPSDALRVSLGLDGLIGENGMTLGLSADFYPNQDEIADPLLQGATLTTQLGPVLTADWQLRLATSGLRELVLYAVDRYRTNYRVGSSVIGDASVDESSGNYLDAGIRSVIGAGQSTGILAAGNFRHQTGLKSDNTLATAAIVSGTLTLGLIHDLGGGYTVQPFARGQAGRIDSDGQATSALGFSGGVTLGLRF